METRPPYEGRTGRRHAPAGIALVAGAELLDAWVSSPRGAAARSYRPRCQREWLRLRRRSFTLLVPNLKAPLMILASALTDTRTCDDLLQEKRHASHDLRRWCWRRRRGSCTSPHDLRA